MVFDAMDKNISETVRKKFQHANYDNVYRGTYPNGMNLKPGTKEHERIKNEVLLRARESNGKMSKRFDSWKNIDRTLTAYMPADEKENVVKSSDPRKPVNVVVPLSYATLETLLTYWTKAFLNNPMIKYSGVGPEDTIGAMLLQGVVDLQCRRGKAALGAHTVGRDGFAYGLGVIGVVWDKVMAKKPVTRDMFEKRWLLPDRYIGREIEFEDTVQYEGNKIVNIDPYRFLPDPNVPIQNVQDMEFVGWCSRENRMSIMQREKASDGDMFNAMYLRHINGESAIFKSDEHGREDFIRYGTEEPSTSTNPVDVIYMYLNIVPEEWGLGSGKYPEKWFFALGGDEIVLQAQPLGLNHNMYPVAVFSPEYDGYSLTPVSKLEVIYGLQEATDFFYKSHFTNVRKAVNDVLIVDPFLINMNDVRKQEPGGIWRLRESAWGKQKLDQAVKQLGISDITRGNVADASFTMDVANRISGTVDILQGIMRSGGERRSATEARDARTSALSRLEKMARLASVQLFQDIGYLYASQTQQFMSKDLYVEITGEWQEKLEKEFNRPVQAGKFPVSQDMLAIDFDVLIHDGTVVENQGNVDSWIQILQVIGTQEDLVRQFDIVRIVKHIATIMGEKNLEDFSKVTPQVMPDEQVQQQAQAGNLVPMDIGGMIQ